MNILFSFVISIFIIFSCLTQAQAVSLETMIGQVDSEVNPDKNKDNDKDNNDDSSSSSSSGGGCPCDISTVQNQVEQDIEDYVKENIEALDKLNEQVDKNIKELENRTNDIVNEDYFTELKNRLKNITKNENIKKYKLLGYRNILFFSDNGIVKKESEELASYSIIKSIEDIENSLITNKGEYLYENK